MRFAVSPLFTAGRRSGQDSKDTLMRACAPMPQPSGTTIGTARAFARDAIKRPG
jgi:hypothetical protein